MQRVEQLTKAAKKFLERPGSVRTSMIAAAAAVALGVVFVSLSAYYGGVERTQQRAEAEAQNTGATQVRSVLAETARRLTLLSGHLAQHRDGAAPFRLIGEHLDPEVGYSEVTVTYTGDAPVLTFAVHAPNAGSIARQTAAFENDDRIRSVSVSPLERERENGRYEATMTMEVDPAVLLAFPNLTQGS